MEDEKDSYMEGLMASFIFEKEETNNCSGLYKESTERKEQEEKQAME